MRRRKVLLFVVLMFMLTGCALLAQPEESGASETEIARGVNQTKTALANTAVGQGKTENAPPPTATFTLTPASTNTPRPTNTAAVTNTPAPTNTQPATATASPAPTEENPWVMQEWCVNHTGCHKYGVRNKTDSWLQVTMEKKSTGETEFFSIQSGRTQLITVRPGAYHVDYVYWCDGEQGTYSASWPINEQWIDVFKCPQGYVTSIYK